MPGRLYFNPTEQSNLEKILNQLGTCSLKLGEVFPSEHVLTLVQHNKQLKFIPMRWGYTCSDKPHINARIESVEMKPSFRNEARTNRCIVCVSGYYEWLDKQRYDISDEASEMLLMAGIYIQYENQNTCCLLSMEPNEIIAQIHHRMPVLLRKEEIGDYLSGKPMKHFEKGDNVKLTVTPVSKHP